MNQDYKEVRFDIYCKKCTYEKNKGHEGPCNECLEYGMNVGSERPVNYKEK